MYRMKLRKTGNSLSTVWPADLLARLNVKQGDELCVIETKHGLMVMPYDPKLEKAAAAARGIIDRDQRALTELSKR